MTLGRVFLPSLVLASVAACQSQQPAPGGPPPSGRRQPPSGGTDRQQNQSRQAAQAATPVQDLCTVEGQVLNALTGEPLGKASLSLRRVESQRGGPGGGFPGGGPRGSYSATSEPSGVFQIKAVEPGEYRLSVKRNGFVDLEYGTRDYLMAGTAFKLVPKQTMGSVQLRMNPHGVVTGRVVDDDGEPVVNVQVQALRTRYSQGQRTLRGYGSASTNDLGEYRIFGLPPGRYYLSASQRRMWGPPERPGMTGTDEEYVATFYPGTADPAMAVIVDVRPGAQTGGMDLRLVKRRTVNVRGRVSDASGSTEPRRAMVMLSPRGVSASPYSARPGLVDANGNFEIRGVAPGPYMLVAMAQQRGRPAAARIPVEVGTANVDRLSITIPPPVSVSGKVRFDAQNVPAPGKMQVRLQLRDATGLRDAFARPVTVTADGTFTIAGVSPDQYSLVVSGQPDGYYVRNIQLSGQDVLMTGLDLRAGAAAAVEVVLRAGAGRLAGSVQDSRQQPVPGATVVAVPQEPERLPLSQFYQTGTADASGAFSINGLDPGQYRVYAWPEIESGAYMDPDFVKASEAFGESVTIREGSQEEVRLKLAEVQQ